MWRLQRRLLLTGLLAGALCSPALAAQTLHKPTAAQVRPQAFGSCKALVGYAQAHFAVTKGVPEQPVVALAETATSAAKSGTTTKTATATPSAAASSDGSTGGTSTTPTFSTTNDQEQGVDEPDIVKTNGSTIFAIAQNQLVATSVAGGTPHVVGTLDLGSNGYGAQLLLSGDRLLLISDEGPIAIESGGIAQPAVASISPYYYGGQTVLTEVDVADPAVMTVTQTMTVDGRFVDARQTGSSARVVISGAPEGIAQPLLRTTAKGWIPGWQLHNSVTGRSTAGLITPCSSIRRPVQFSGLGMLSIVTVDFNRGLALADTDSLMADAQIVYGSQTSLYVATQSWINPESPYSQVPSSQSTVIDRFDITNPDTTTFVSSGEVPGYLLNQFSLSEYNGYLRVASTSKPVWWGIETPDSVNPAPPPSLSQSYVTVLATQGNVLAPVGQISGLGAGEQIYSVRFVDDTGYVVTYRQVDPLYTIDLSNPMAPRVAGQLELEGYSAYLHPLGDGLLLGVGQSVDPTSNEPSGAQLDLFDVSNPAAPTLLQQSTLGLGSSSQVQYDHHAFLYWPATNLAVLPVQIYGAVSYPVVPSQPSTTTTPFVGAIGFHLDRASGITEVGRITQDLVNGSTPVIERSLVIGDQLYTLSDEGLMASNLSTLAPEAFVAFPTPPTVSPQPVPVVSGTVKSAASSTTSK